MAEIVDWFNQMPILTRYWFGSSVVLPLLCKFGLLSPLSVVLTSDFLSKFQLWKPLTATFFYPLNGNRGFQYLMNLYFLYNYSNRLEQGYFNGRTADYCFLLIFNWISLVVISYAMNILILMDPMIMSVLYVYCIINQEQIVNFWFGTRFKARYLPWALFGMNFLLGGGGITELAGILVGHMYYFVMMKYPADQGVYLLRTPQILQDYFANLERARDIPNRPAPPQAGIRQQTRPPPEAASPTGYDWGRGRRLED